MADLKSFEAPTRADVTRLLEDREGPLISIYLPVHRFGPETELDKVRMKNLLGKAAEELKQAGLRRPEIEELLAPAQDLLEDGYFWQHQSDGLAVFAGPGFFEHYRLPYEVDELVAVDDKIHTKPLLPALAADGEFYVLALSRGACRLLRGSRSGIEELDISEYDIPASFDEAMQYDDFEKRDGELQHRSQSDSGNSRAGNPVFHGHAYGDEDMKKDMQRYFHMVNNGINRALRGTRAPLVIAGVDEAQGFFRQLADYRHIAPEGVDGNPDQLKPDELQAKAWPIAERELKSDIEAAAEKFLQQHGTGLGTTDLAEALTAAHGGRVETLFLRRGEQRWGGFDLNSASAEVSEEQQPGQTDLLDLAARKTLGTGGNVYLVEAEHMPTEDVLAAVFRY